VVLKRDHLLLNRAGGLRSANLGCVRTGRSVRMTVVSLPAAEAGGTGRDSHDPNSSGHTCACVHVTLFESVWESWRGHDSATGFPVRSHHPPIRSAIRLAGRRLRANSFTATHSLYDARSSFVNCLQKISTGLMDSIWASIEGKCCSEGALSRRSQETKTNQKLLWA
jgi:hypothetical protein